MSTIECCINSVDADQRARLERYGTVRGYRCLEHCESCRTDAAVVVDGDLLRGIEDVGRAVAATAGDGP